MINTLKSTLFYSVFFIVTLIIINSWMSLEILDPANFMWLLEKDYKISFSSLHLFRYSDWSIPFGAIDKANFPIGTNVLVFDGNLFLSLLTKVFSAVLPTLFQPYGLWVFLCIYLQFSSIFWAIRQVGRVSLSSAFLGAMLIGLLPTFYFRVLHLNLLPHFLIIFSWGIFFSIFISNKRKFYLLAFITLFSTLIHFYFTPFFLLMTLLHLWKWQEFRTDSATIYWIARKGIILMTLLLSLMAAAGYFSLYSPFSGGNYSMNLNALINPMGHSKFIKTLALASDEQREGFQYLGLGLMLFTAISLLFTRKIFNGIEKQVWYFFAGVFFFSLSYKIYLAHILLFHLHLHWKGITIFCLITTLLFFPKNKVKAFIYCLFGCLVYWILAKTLRSSGRMFWFDIYPLLIIIFINTNHYIMQQTKHWRKILWPMLIVFLITIQVIDVSSLYQMHYFKDSSLINVKNTIEYQLAKKIEATEKKIIFIDVDDSQVKERLWTWFVIFLGDKAFNFSPAPESRKNIRYASRKDSIADTLNAGGIIITNKCAAIIQYKLQFQIDNWCAYADPSAN